MFGKGYSFTYGGLAFEKQDDNEFGLWLCLNSNYVKEYKDKEGFDKYEVRPESELPPERRYGFKWTDEQVKNYYNL